MGEHDERHPTRAAHPWPRRSPLAAPAFLILWAVSLLSPVTPARASGGPTPYGGSPVAVSATATTRVEAEDYDRGGEGVAYHDEDDGGMTSYRGDNVGIYEDSNASGGHAVGWNAGGEWDGYTLSVSQPGPYAVTARVSSDHSGGRFHLEFGPVGRTGGAGVVRSAEYTVPYASGGFYYQDVTAPPVSLSAGTVWMRVVADDSYPCNFDFFRLTPAAAFPSVTGLSFSPDPVANGGSVGGFLTLSGPAPAGGMALALSSDNAAAQVPPTVTVYPYATTAYFPVTTTAVTDPTTAHITVSGVGTPVTAALTLSPSVSLSALSASWADGGSHAQAGGGPAYGYISLNGPAPAGGVTVGLASDSAAVQVAATVQVPAGSSYGDFPITTSAVTAPTTAHLTATLGGVTRQADLSLVPFGLSRLFLSPSTVHGGDPSTGYVALSGPAPAGGLTVGLTGDSGDAQVPPSVTIPEGRNGTSFPVTTSAVPATTPVHVTASGTGAPQTALLTLSPLSAPSAPSGLIVNPSPTGPATVRVDLNWSAASGATGYAIERSPDYVTWTQIGTTAATAYQDATAAAGTHYWYRVKATGGDTYSNAAYADTAFPYLVCTDLAWTPDPVFAGDQVRFYALIQNLGTAPSYPFTWTVEFEGDPGETGYNIEANPLAPGDTLLVTEQFDQWWTATPGFHNIAVVIDDSYVSLSKTLTVACRAPLGLTATAAGSEIDLAWQPSAGATGYTVERSPDGSTGWTQIGTPTATTYQDTGLTAGTTYFYRMRATSAGTTSAPSNIANATTAPPTPPVDGMSYFTTIRNTDWTYAGYGGMRGIGAGTLTLTGVTGAVTHAYLYWHGPTNTDDPAANAAVTFAGHTITGTNIGVAADNFWSFHNSQAYRADVTSLVTGDGSYSLAGFTNAVADINGVSLMVFYDGDPAHYRDVTLFDGNDSNEAIGDNALAPYILPSNALSRDGTFGSLSVPTSPLGGVRPGTSTDQNYLNALSTHALPNLLGSSDIYWDETFGNVSYLGGDATLYLGVSDGQFTYNEEAMDGEVDINGAMLMPMGDDFSGDSVPDGPSAIFTNGGLWDTKGYGLSSFLHPGVNTLHLTAGLVGDYLSLVYAVIDQPSAGAAQGPLRPMNLTAVAGDTQVSLSWSPVAGVTYTLARALSPAGPFQAVATGLTATTYVDTGLTDGTTYDYVVTADDAFGTSAASNVAQATPHVAPDFTLAPAAGALTLAQGASGTQSITVSPVNGFTGDVDLYVEGGAGILGGPGDPTKIAATLDPAAVTLDGTDPASVTLSLSVGAQVPPGTYALQVTGADTSGTRVHSAPVSVTVTPVPALVGLLFDNHGVTGNYSGQGSVKLNAPALAGGVQVALTSDSTRLHVPASVHIDAGSDFANFPYSINRSTTPTLETKETATVTAIYNNVSKTDTVEMYTDFQLDAAGTGHSKISLYWTAVLNAAGYNIYRSLSSDGPWVQINDTPITTLDPGPVSQPVYMFTDTGQEGTTNAELTDGVTYYYYIAAVMADGTVGAVSNQDSATPDPNAVPWDTGDASQILSKVDEVVNANLMDDEDPIDTFIVGGPDGVTYTTTSAGAAEASTPAAAYNPTTGCLDYDDGTSVPSPLEGPSSGWAADPNASPESLFSPVPNIRRQKAGEKSPYFLGSSIILPNQFDYDYPAEPSPHAGILRKVEAQPGENAVAAYVTLPPVDRWNANVNGFPNSPLLTRDTAYMYMGGSVYHFQYSNPTGTQPGHKWQSTGEIDAGVTLSKTDALGWQPFILGAGKDFQGYLIGCPYSGDDRVQPLPGNKNIPIKVYVNGPVLMSFKAPGYGTIPSRWVVLSLHEPLSLPGSMFYTDARNSDPSQQMRLRNVALVNTHTSWSNLNNDPDNAFVLKRANSIAQVFTVVPGGPHNATSLYPTPNGPGSDPYTGFYESGSYVYGASWGDIWDPDDFVLDGVGLNPGFQWNENLTFLEGSYPGPEYHFVTKLIQNQFFWEQQVNLDTSHP